MPTRRPERDDVAAWVLKANPDMYDVEAALQVPAIESWRLADSYRRDLISVGDPCLLWVTGKDRGFYAAGKVTGLPADGQGGGHWVDSDEKSKVRPYLPVDMKPILGIREEELLSDLRFREAEFIRSRRIGSPSCLNASQFDVVRGLMER
jgi:hypothetical protein